MAVSKERIVEAAIDMLNRAGVENLNMRALAMELGIKAASLYWHIKGKEELYGLIAETMCVDIDIAEDLSDVEEKIRDLNLKWRESLLSVRDAVIIFAESMPITPRRVELINYMFKLLRAWGVDEKNIFPVANLLNNYVLSFVADEIRFRKVATENSSDYPNPFDVDLNFDEKEIDRQFVYGINVLLTGIKETEKG